MKKIGGTVQCRKEDYFIIFRLVKDVRETWAEINAEVGGYTLTVIQKEAMVRQVKDDAADRLSSYGAGPYCPVSVDATEEGRAKNRRVGLVRQQRQLRLDWTILKIRYSMVE